MSQGLHRIFELRHASSVFGLNSLFSSDAELIALKFDVAQTGCGLRFRFAMIGSSLFWLRLRRSVSRRAWAPRRQEAIGTGSCRTFDNSSLSTGFAVHIAGEDCAIGTRFQQLVQRADLLGDRSRRKKSSMFSKVTSTDI